MRGGDVDRDVDRPAIRGARAMSAAVRVADDFAIDLADEPGKVAQRVGNPAPHLVRVRRVGLEGDRRRFDDRAIQVGDRRGVAVTDEADSRHTSAPDD